MKSYRVEKIDSETYGILFDDDSFKEMYTIKPCNVTQITHAYEPMCDLYETWPVRRYWRFSGCKKWQDNFFDALADKMVKDGYVDSKGNCLIHNDKGLSGHICIGWGKYREQRRYYYWQ